MLRSMCRRAGWRSNWAILGLIDSQVSESRPGGTHRHAGKITGRAIILYRGVRELEEAVLGKLEMIVGPMRSNKTAELLRRIEIRKQYAKQDVMLLKPPDDTRPRSDWWKAAIATAAERWRLSNSGP